MRFPLPAFILLFGITLLVPACSGQGGGKSDEAALKNVDAVQAIAIANQWKWSKKEIKSYVTPREVIFEFPNGRVKKIPLPKDKMYVAVAPYITQTHG
jgi:hypothetical protein